MKEQLQAEGIIKEEKVGYLKTKINLMQGTLYLTHKRVVLDAHKTGVGGMGLLGAFLKKKVEEKSFGFNLEFNQLGKIEQGTHGRNPVLEITDNNNNTYRIMVKDFSEWENAINQKR